MGESNTCCTWKVATNGGKQSPTLTEGSYIATAGYRPLAYRCVNCTNQQTMKLIRENVPGDGWAGKINQ